MGPKISNEEDRIFFVNPDTLAVAWTKSGLVVISKPTEADIQRGIELAKERGWANNV